MSEAFDSPATTTASGRQRSKSTAALRAIVKPNRYRTQQNDASTLKALPNGQRPLYKDHTLENLCMLPLNHPHASKYTYGEDVSSQPCNGSSIVDLENKIEQEYVTNTADSGDGLGHRRTYANVSKLLLKQKSPGKTAKDSRKAELPKDKENTTPPRSSREEVYTPIWAQFTSQPVGEIVSSTTVDEHTHEDLARKAGSRVPQDFSDLKLCNLPYHMLPVFGRDDTSAVSTSTSSPSPNKQPINKNVLASAAAKQDEAPDVVLPTDPNSLQSHVLNADASSPERSSRLINAAAFLSRKEHSDDLLSHFERKNLEQAFEAVLISRNIPEHRRDIMQNLDPKIKAELIRHHREVSNIDRLGSSHIFHQHSAKYSLEDGRRVENVAIADQDSDETSPSKRSRSRSRTFTFAKGDRSPSKRQRSNSRPRSFMSLKNLSSSSVNTMGLDGTGESKEVMLQSVTPVTPEEFVAYLKSEKVPETMEVGKVHKLRILLRNETIRWVSSFIEQDGMTELLRILELIVHVEWREEHEDVLLHEVLLCFKALCTTDLALEKLDTIGSVLFSHVLKMVFDEERKGPSDFNTRAIVFSLLLSYLTGASVDQQVIRARSVLSFLEDPCPAEQERPVGFILEMRQRRPYQKWCKEISNVTKEVFWIFSHHDNVITPPSSISSLSTAYKSSHFPKERPPVPAAPYVGGVEWDATMYIAAHLDLLNGLIALLHTREDRNELRQELKDSGFERLMGETLRKCTEKFYSAVHDGLKTWVAAAMEDEWNVAVVTVGPPKEEKRSPIKSPKKPASLLPPRLDSLPKLELRVGVDLNREEVWLP